VVQPLLTPVVSCPVAAADPIWWVVACC